MFSSQVVDRDGLPPGEYYALVLFSIVGMIMMATANDLLVIFIALEILSLAVYVLTGIRRDDPAGTEAAFKYFLLGAFSSAFFLYGIAFTYGVTGSTRLAAIGIVPVGAVDERQPDDPDRARPAAGRLRLQDLRGAVPHVDAGRLRGRAGHRHRLHVHRREGGGVCRVRARVPLGVRAVQRDWAPVVAVLAAATMILGTVVGVAQSNLKRMLAYSSIAHGGYLLVGLVAANSGRQGGDPVLPAGVLGDQPRGVRRDRAARHARPRQRRAARLRRPVAHAARRSPR